MNQDISEKFHRVDNTDSSVTLDSESGKLGELSQGG